MCTVAGRNSAARFGVLGTPMFELLHASRVRHVPAAITNHLFSELIALRSDESVFAGGVQSYRTAM